METTATRVEGGQFLWHDLVARDLDTAIDFYTHVVGWTTQAYDFPDNDGPVYTMWVAGGTPVGGVMQYDSKTMGEMPPAWSAYIFSPDADAAVAKTKKLGGNVLMEPMDLPTVGRMATLTDPQGAVFCVLTPASSEPMPEAPEVGSFSWNELATTDLESAFKFYRELFGWRQWDDMDMGDGGMYRMFGKDEKMYGGIYNKPPDMPAPPHWLFYIKVPDLESALERVKERGGRVLNGPVDVPGDEHVAQCVDPEGAAFGLHAKKK